MKAWVKNIGTVGEVKEIGNGLEAMQEIVGGYIECVRLPREIDLWIDEEGLLKETPKINLQIMGRSGEVYAHIVGNVFFAGHDGEGNSIDLTPFQIHWLEQNMKTIGLNLDVETKEMYVVHGIFVN